MRRIAIPLGLSLIFGACGKREEVTAEQTRPLTMRDENLSLNASSDERFSVGMEETPESPIIAGFVPQGWTQAPSSAFRLINYRFGEKGEAYVSLSRGGIIDNVNRWLGQFGGEKLDAEGLAALETVETAGFKGVWVSVDGDFGGGMGQPAQTGWALRGVVAEGPDGTLTVKLLGPIDEVKSAEPELKKFVAGLKAGS